MMASQTLEFKTNKTIKISNRNIKNFVKVIFNLMLEFAVPLDLVLTKIMNVNDVLLLLIANNVQADY